MISEKELTGLSDSDQLLVVARELAAGKYINDVLLGIVAADRYYHERASDEALNIVYSAGEKIGHLYKPEAERVFGKYPLDSAVRSVFDALSYRGDENPDNLGYSRRDDIGILIGGIDTKCECEEESCERRARFHTYTDQFKDFLGELGFSSENTRILKSDRRSEGKDMLQLMQGIEPHTNLVVYFTGIGSNGEIALNDDSEMRYEKMFTPLQNHKGNMIFVNETSYAGSASKALRKIGLLPDRMLFLSACAENESGNGNMFTKYLMWNYREGKKFEDYTLSDTYPSVEERLVVGVADGIPVPIGFAIGLGFEEHKQTFSRQGPDFDYILMKQLPALQNSLAKQLEEILKAQK